MLPMPCVLSIGSMNGLRGRFPAYQKEARGVWLRFLRGRHLCIYTMLTAVILFGAAGGAARPELALARSSTGVLHTFTESDNGTTLTIPVGDSVELRLSTNFDWSVTLSN